MGSDGGGGGDESDDECGEWWREQAKGRGLERRQVKGAECEPGSYKHAMRLGE